MSNQRSLSLSNGQTLRPVFIKPIAPSPSRPDHLSHFFPAVKNFNPYPMRRTTSLISGTKEIRAAYAATVWPFEICRQNVNELEISKSATTAATDHIAYQASDQAMMTMQRIRKERAIELARLETKLHEIKSQLQKQNSMGCTSTWADYPLSRGTNDQPASGMSGGFICIQAHDDLAASPDQTQFEPEISPANANPEFLCKAIH